MNVIVTDVKNDAKKFVSVMKVVAQDAAKGLAFACKYAVPVASLVSLIFPAAAPEATGAATALTLIQSAVLEVEQKAAALPAGLSGQEKLADVLQLAEPTVVALLAKEGVTLDAGQVTSIVNAVVAILNAQPAPVVAAAA